MNNFRLGLGMIYLIGGRPRSGKSIIRKRFLDDHGIEGFGTDFLRAMLKRVGGIDPENSPVEDGARVWPYIDRAIKYYLKSERKDLLIEGDVLLPIYLSKHLNNPEVKACYIGYSNIAVCEKIESIKNNDSDSDFTMRYSEEELELFVKSSIEKSLKYKKECLELGVRYFDIETDFESSIRGVIKDLLDIKTD
jgi:hypothetical protein